MPTPAEIKEARLKLSISQEKAGAIIGVTGRTWRRWERGDETMRSFFWELFQLKTQQEGKQQ